MKPKIRSVLFMFIGAPVAIAVLWIVAPLSIREMESDSMMPLIRGRGSPPSREGDHVLVLTWLRFSTPKAGDLVLVEIPAPGGAVETIRRIKSVDRGEQLRFTIESLDPEGIDSRQFGFLGIENVKGKILHVFKS
jgi:type IV secretory pathway protease TraF